MILLTPMMVSKDEAKRNLSFFLLLFLLVLSGCNSGSLPPDEISKKQTRRTPLKLDIDLDGERKLQEAADQGFQSWRNDPIEVAEACLTNGGVFVIHGKTSMLSNDGSNAIVTAQAKSGDYIVHLKRIIKPGGIWTAIKVEKEE